MDLSSLYICSMVHPESRMLVFTDPASGALFVEDLVICGQAACLRSMLGCYLSEASDLLEGRLHANASQQTSTLVPSIT